jgi:hypothetical protein
MQTGTTVTYCEAFTVTEFGKTRADSHFRWFKHTSVSETVSSSSWVLNHTSILIMEIGLVSEMLVCLNHVLWLSGQKDVTEHCISTCQKTGNEKLRV